MEVAWRLIPTTLVRRCIPKAFVRERRCASWASATRLPTRTPVAQRAQRDCAPRVRVVSTGAACQLQTYHVMRRTPLDDVQRDMFATTVFAILFRVRSTPRSAYVTLAYFAVPSVAVSPKDNAPARQTALFIIIIRLIFAAAAIASEISVVLPKMNAWLARFVRSLANVFPKANVGEPSIVAPASFVRCLKIVSMWARVTEPTIAMRVNFVQRRTRVSRASAR